MYLLFSGRGRYSTASGLRLQAWITGPCASQPANQTRPEAAQQHHLEPESPASLSRRQIVHRELRATVRTVLEGGLATDDANLTSSTVQLNFLPHGPIGVHVELRAAHRLATEETPTSISRPSFQAAVKCAPMKSKAPASRKRTWIAVSVKSHVLPETTPL